jgi:dihydrofolate synthase/folylpolyglutamate synthase
MQSTGLTSLNVLERESEALTFLDSLDISAMKLGLERIKAVLETLGNPQDAVPIVHIAGTNGKGSVTAMLSNVLTMAGHKTGRFISPHLISVRERIAIDNESISAEPFAKAVFKLKAHLEELDWPRDDWPTYFEFINIVAYQYFVAQNVDVAVFETGLGGRLDSTNVVQAPVLTVITSIGLDHMKLLGDTLAAIAFEKAGILKQNVPLVLGGNLPAEAQSVIVKQANVMSAPMFQAHPDDLLVEPSLSRAETGLVIRKVSTGDSFRLSLTPPYQKDNAAIVLSCVEQLREQGFAISSAALGEGLATTVWPARFQLFPKERILVDGSHNADGFLALAEALRFYYTDTPFIWSLSLRNNRPIEVFLNLLDVFQQPLAIIVTAGEPQGLYHEPEILTQILESYYKGFGLPRIPLIKAVQNPLDALEALRFMLKSDSSALGIVTGSLYTAGAILSSFNREEIGNSQCII